MNRREALQRVGLLMGGAVIGAEFFISGCKSGGSAGNIADLGKPESIAYLDEIAETILPATKTPGAKAAKVGAFMVTMVTDCYTQENQEVFLDGLDKLNESAKKAFNKKFIDASPQQRTQLLTRLDSEQRDYQKNKKKEDPNHYFKMLKELTLLGYFTSEVGATQALRYLPVPGKYDGNYAYKKGDKAWALN